MERYSLLTMFFTAIVVSTSAAEVIDIPDATLKTAIQKTLGVTGDPTASEMLDLQLLDADGLGVADLTGLEYAINLRNLHLRENNPGIELLYDPSSGQHTLTVSSTEGGVISVPGEGKFSYLNGEEVAIGAMPDHVHRFAGWTGSAVNHGKVADPFALQTMVTVDGEYSLLANFAVPSDPWRVVYTEDFEGEVGPEWSRGDRDVTPRGERWFLGQFGNDAVTLTLQALAPHTGVRVSSDLFIIRSWDGNGARHPGPDIWELTADPQRRLLRTTFDNLLFPIYVEQFEHRQSYPREYPDGHFLPRTAAVETDTLGYTYDFTEIGLQPVDSVYRITRSFVHVSPTLRLTFSASGLQGLDDESWGLDNVRVELTKASIVAHNPSPANGATNVTSPVLRWTAGPTAIFHDVYFGRISELGTRTFVGRQTTTEYVRPFTLPPGVTYYWRIDEVEADETTVHTGEVWSFTAGEAGAIDEPAMGESFGQIDFDNAEDFDEKVAENNFEHPTHPEYDRVHVELVEGLEPDPNGMMRMQNLADVDPDSPMYGRIVHARAKGTFGPCDKAGIVVRFSYLFERSAPGLELMAHLSDVPDLLDHGDPHRYEHYVLIGRVPMPPEGRPGSLESGRFAVFEEWVSTGAMDLSKGMWVELELVEDTTLTNPVSSTGGLRLASLGDGGGSVLVDDWAVEVYCDGICMDLNWSDTADEEDFLLVIASCGSSATMLEGGVGSRYCLDGAFSSDGYVDIYDVQSWDWALGDARRVVGNFCRVPLPLVGTDEETMRSLSMFTATPGPPLQLASVSSLPGDLLVLGKRRMSTASSQLLQDCFCVFGSDGSFVVDYTPSGLPVRCNIKVVRSPADELYLVNSERGVLRIDDAIEEIIPPGKIIHSSDPRYGQASLIYVGIQGDGSDCYGRPVLDVAFDAAGYAYVVPVVAAPLDREPYVAAARLRLQAGADPPYEVVQLYDDPPPANDNQHRNHLREIEVDAAGNVYLVNAHRLNESCILWKYDVDGVLLQRLDLPAPDSESKVTDPLALYVSHDGATLYLASGQQNPQSPNDSVVYGLSTENFTPVRSIAIKSVQQVTSITEDPATGTLWVAGFSMPEIPAWPSATEEPFYVPRLAEVPPEAENAVAAPISDPAENDLALPTAILWTGERE